MQSEELLVLERQTVGQVAKMAVRFWTGWRHDGRFPQYWHDRKQRSHCAGWFDVQLSRASQGAWATPEERVPHIRAVRTRIDRLPKLDRAWTLLYLHGETASLARCLWSQDSFGTGHLVSDAELLAACRDLGRERLLRMLEKKTPSDDPDLAGWMSWFVFDHVEQLFRPEDADFFLAQEDRPLWAIAAAQLQPRRAKAILHQSFGRYAGDAGYQRDQRAELAAALWRQVGASEAAFLVDWFYREEPQMGQFPHCRGWFLRQLGGVRVPEDRRLAARLIQHPRFHQLDWQSLIELIRLANDWTDRPLVDEDELRGAWHPLGESHFHWQQAEAARDYPSETAQLLQRLANWRQALRESIPSWE
jgi:hypothetical protein